jgi:hypothetical protein
MCRYENAITDLGKLNGHARPTPTLEREKMNAMKLLQVSRESK